MPAVPRSIHKSFIAEASNVATSAALNRSSLFHAAAQMAFPRAESFISKCTVAAGKRAGSEIANLSKMASAHGLKIAQCAVLMASDSAIPDLKTILASHTRIHAAEGEFYRAVIAGACDRARIKVIRLKERDLAGAASMKLKLTESEIKWRIDAFGKSLGPPRAADQKLSVMAAWLGLAA